jgi:hypothetical protein
VVSQGVHSHTGSQQVVSQQTGSQQVVTQQSLPPRSRPKHAFASLWKAVATNVTAITTIIIRNMRFRFITVSSTKKWRFD